MTLQKHQATGEEGQQLVAAFIMEQFSKPEVQKRLDDLVWPEADMIKGDGCRLSEPKGIISYQLRDS